MTKEQIVNEINYKKSVALLQRLLRTGLITEEQYQKINQLNMETFQPELKAVYR